MIIRTLSAFFALLFFATTSFAQYDGINYQAVLRDASGAILANQSVTLQLTINSGTPTGSQQYQETHTVTTDQFGLFDLAIGQGTSGTGFNFVDWDNDVTFLTVEWDDNGTWEILGTTRFNAVPYAIQAAQASRISSPGVRSDDPAVTGYSLTIDTMARYWNGGEVINISANSAGQLAISPNTAGNDVLILDDDGGGLELMLGGITVDSDAPTSPEPRTLYGNMVPLAYGYVIGGTLNNATVGVFSMTNSATGVYDFTLRNGWTGYPAVICTPIQSGVANEICTVANLSLNSNSFTVNVANVNAAPVAANSSFMFVVYGTPSN